MSAMQIIISVTGLLAGAGAGVLWVFAPWNSGARKGMARKMNTSFVFSGNLRQTNLLEAVQFLEIGRREGILHIYSGRRKGYLIFSNGSVFDAFFRNATGREAVFSMLGLEEGDFYFEPKSITQSRLIHESVMDIAFEWDERKRGGQ
jgi:hypothetical protein